MTITTDKYKKVLQDFDTHIRSTKSIKGGNHYTGHIKRFLIYLESKEIYSLNEITAETMKQYFAHLTTRPKLRGKSTLCKPSTVNGELSTLRIFSKRMQQGKIIKKGLPISNNIKVEKSAEHSLFALVRNIVTTEEIKSIFEATINPTEKALIALAYGCGLRRSSLANLEDQHIDFTNGQVIVIQAKNNKTRTVPISDFFLKVLQNYSLKRLTILRKNNKRTPNYFLYHNGNPIPGEKLNDLLKDIIKRTNDITLIEKNITLHCLRHSIATHLLDNGQSFEYVKTFLGHSYIDTTSLYARRRKIKNYYTV